MNTISSLAILDIAIQAEIGSITVKTTNCTISVLTTDTIPPAAEYPVTKTASKIEQKAVLVGHRE